jgi:hypothetical protein
MLANKMEKYGKMNYGIQLLSYIIRLSEKTYFAARVRGIPESELCTVTGLYVNPNVLKRSDIDL